MMPSTNSTQSHPRTFTLASRKSQLAQIQTNHVLAALQNAFPSHNFATSFMSTGGDVNQSQALYLLGGKALWTKELEVELRENKVDILVHSLKDVPTQLPEGCEIGAILEREDPVDSLVVKSGEPWKTIEELPEGSIIGTSSVRRVAQLKRQFPHLKFADVRGNLNTRLAKLDAPDGQYKALVLAKAGLIRLDLGGRITSDVGPPTLYHAVSQGALAAEIRSNDPESRKLCEALIHWPTQWRCLAERSCLRVLEGGCSVPVGVFSELEADASGERVGLLNLTGCVTALDGQTHVQHSLSEKVTSQEEAELLGSKLANILIETGARAILDDINVDRMKKVEESFALGAQIEGQ